MQTREPQRYVGRFAPSPTGPLHFGSLVAAVASYLDARANNGEWLLRIEDIDPPREQSGATNEIIKALRAYGFEWDRNVIYQSDTAQQHDAALQTLIENHRAYPCTCSRSDMADLPRGELGIIYPGTCRDGCRPGEHSVRVLTDERAISFNDSLQGNVTQRLASESGDFIVRRRDGLVAYHLGVVVDDALQGITHIVRGIDLLDSTPRQIWLQQLLGYPTPQYAHIPVVVQADGDKLSKLTGAKAVPLDNQQATLHAALVALRQQPPSSLLRDSVSSIWNWALQNWRIGQLINIKTLANNS